MNLYYYDIMYVWVCVINLCKILSTYEREKEKNSYKKL